VSKWPGKYVIGLTGNIATGKSVVRKMLEHLGAYTIDADALAHRAIAKDAPGYRPVVDTFGNWILNKDEQIDRGKLGRLVFNNPEALAQLESILHPLIGQAIDLLAKRARQRVVVIEAIKLLESELHTACDTIWVTSATEGIQTDRLMRKRGLSREVAQQRIHAQPPQEEKIAAAKVVIRNTASYDDLWKQVTAAWKKISPTIEVAPIMVKEVTAGEYAVQSGGPRDSKSIAGLITRLSKGMRTMTADDVMVAFGEKAFLLLKREGQLVGLAGWQVENLVARTIDLYVAPDVPLEKVMVTLVSEVERASRDLQCEASLLFLPPDLASHEAVWTHLGYERRTLQTLGVQAWQDAARESMPPGTNMFFKQLRQDRVLHPI
jgi:dephospho-CoA kinase